MKWIYATAAIIALGIMGYAYTMLNAPDAQTPVPVSTATTSRSITVYHAYKDGEHRFSGSIKLPHSCYSLEAGAERDAKNENILNLTFTTKDKMLDQSLCAKIPTNYPFQVINDGPENITVHGTLNSETINVKLIETSWQSSAGTYINPINN